MKKFSIYLDRRVFVMSGLMSTQGEKFSMSDHSIIGRDDVSTVYCYLDWDVNWCTPVQ